MKKLSIPCLFVGVLVGSLPHLAFNSVGVSWLMVLLLGTVIAMAVWLLAQIPWTAMAGATHHLARLPEPSDSPKD